MPNDCQRELPPALPQVELNKVWTILLFIDARISDRWNRTAMPLIVERLSNHGSTQINILVQWGGRYNKTYRFPIPHDRPLSRDEIPPQTGSWEIPTPRRGEGGATVKCFLEYASHYYPADNYAVFFLAQHGNMQPFALRGLILFSILNTVRDLLLRLGDSKSFILKSMFERTEKRVLDLLSRFIVPWKTPEYVDADGELTLKSLACNLRKLKREPPHLSPKLIVLDACSLASVECMYEFEDIADYVVASPGTILIQTEETYSALLSWLVGSVRRGTAHPEAFACQAAAKLSIQRMSLLFVDVTETGNRTQVDQLVTSLEAFAAALADLPVSSAVWDAVAAARMKFHLPDNSLMYDLYSFANELFQDTRTPDSIKDLARNVRTNFTATHFQIYGQYLPGWSHLAIYFPSTRTPGDEAALANFKEMRLATMAPSWLRFLERYWAHTS